MKRIKPVAPGQRRLPLVIRDAVDAARHIPGLPRGVKATLAAIVSFVDKADPSATVFARKQKIAERADCTDRTVRNHLRLLEEEGYILSKEQEHAQETGKFKVTHLQLTDKLKSILGLDAEPEPQEKFSEPKENFSGAANKGLSVPSSISQIDNPAQAVGIVPADLKPLSERMDAPGIFSLMKKARTHGHRLGDVVAVAQPRIAKLDLRGGRLFKYLSALLVSGACFAYTGQQARAEACNHNTEVVAQAKAAAYKELWKGKQFIMLSKSTMQPKALLEFDESADYVLIYDFETRTVKGTLPLFGGEDVKRMVDAYECGLLIPSSTI